MLRHRGQRRFWVTLDARYRSYIWPQSIAAKCPNCAALLRFAPEISHCWAKADNGYQLLELAVGGKKKGHGACLGCGKSYSSVTWPEDAYYKATVQGGAYWVWNEDYLPLLRARVAGDRVRERQLCLGNQGYHYFLTRLPKYLLIRRHRDIIVRRIDQWLADATERA